MSGEATADTMNIVINQSVVDLALLARSIFKRLPAAQVAKLERRLTRDRVLKSTSGDLQHVCELVGFSCMMALDEAIKQADESEAPDGTSEGTI